MPATILGRVWQDLSETDSTRCRGQANDGFDIEGVSIDNPFQVITNVNHCNIGKQLRSGGVTSLGVCQSSDNPTPEEEVLGYRVGDEMRSSSHGESRVDRLPRSGVL